MTPFQALCRTFLEQLFAGEEANSEIRLRQGMIWAAACLAAPGLFIAIQFGTNYTILLRFAPARAETMVTVLAALFVAYSCVTMAVVGTLAWESLTIDRRDVLVVGPLPVPGHTVVAAKVAALAIFLLGGSAAINLITAVPLSLAISGTVSATAIARHVAGHMLTTMAAAATVFCLLVTLRGVLEMASARAAAAAAAPLQFAAIAVALTFAVFALASTQTILLPADAVEWVPPFWFVGLYERLYGYGRLQYGALANRAVWGTAAAAAAALVTVAASNAVLTQRALAPASRRRAGGMFAGWLTIAMRVFTGSSPTARAAADFVLATLLRNRAHQTLVAINAALAVPIVAFAIARRGGSLEALMQPRRLVLWIPLVAVYAVAVGLRASFVVPSQLRASWTFIANGPEASRAYRTATRAVLLAVLLTVAGVMCAAVAPLVGVRTAVPHAAFVGLLTIALAEVVLLTLHQLPFIAPYAAGHARLRTRWPFYALGLVMFAWLPVQFEALAVRGRLTWSGLLGWTAAATVAAVGASLWRAHPWTISTAEEPEEEHELVTLRVGELANS